MSFTSMNFWYALCAFHENFISNLAELYTCGNTCNRERGPRDCWTTRELKTNYPSSPSRLGAKVENTGGAVLSS